MLVEIENAANKMLAVRKKGKIMSIVYITDQGSALYKRNERLYLKKGDQIIRWFHTKDIEQLIIMGNIALTSQVITYLLKHKIDTVFMSYFGKYKGRLSGELGKNVQLRIDQYNAFQNEEKMLELCKKYVMTKALNSLALLRSYQYRYHNDQISKAILQINAFIQYNIMQATKPDEVRGFEGIIAKHYFSVFPQLIRNPEFQFNGRSRRPPLDEPNALLSLTYTFLMNQVLSKASIAGVDPYMGVLHQVDYGRVSFVLDLMEQFRPLCDHLVIKTLNRKEMRKEHFVYNAYVDSEDDMEGKSLPVALNSDGMKKIVFAFNSMLKNKYYDSKRNGQFPLENIIQEQVYCLCRYIQNKEDYEGFIWQPE